MAIHEMEILDTTGHTTRQWDASSEAEMEIIRGLFDRLTTKGYKAFRVEMGAGSQAAEITPSAVFDPEAKKTLLVPPIQAG